MSLRDFFRTQRKISGIETLAGLGTMAVGAITGNKTVTAVGAGLTTAGVLTNPDLPMCRWPYPRIRYHFWHGLGCEWRMHRLADRLAFRMAHGLFRPRPRLHFDSHHHPRPHGFRPFGPHRDRG